MRTQVIECLRQLTRYPFTLCMVSLLVAAGIYGRAHFGPLDSVVHQQSAHSAHLLWRGELHRLFTSLWFTAGGWRFYSSLAMLAVAVGWAENQFGTATAVVAFISIHIATQLLMSVGIALTTSLVESYRGNLLWYVKDVGPSAGYYGCLGLAVATLVPAVRLAVVLGVLAILLVRLGWTSYYLPAGGQVMSADLAHLIAFPLGLVLSRFVGSQP